jgi:hypothetical protein
MEKSDFEISKMFNIDHNDIELYIKDFYNLIESYKISINPQYQFIYDEFMNHIIRDTIKKYKNKSSNQLKLVGFRSCFYQHFKSKNWHDKLMAPEKCSETMKRLRKYKLEKINKNYGN